MLRPYTRNGRDCSARHASSAPPIEDGSSRQARRSNPSPSPIHGALLFSQAIDRLTARAGGRPGLMNMIWAGDPWRRGEGRRFANFSITKTWARIEQTLVRNLPSKLSCASA